MPSHSRRHRRHESPSDSEVDQYSYDSAEEKAPKRSSKHNASHTSSRRRSGHHKPRSTSSGSRSASSDPSRSGSSSEDAYAKTTTSHHNHSRSSRTSGRRQDRQQSASELENLSMEEMKQEEQGRAKWIQSRNLLKEARTAAIRNQRQPRKDPLVSRPVLGPAEEAAAAGRATAMVTQQLQSLVQEIANFRAGKSTPLNDFQAELRATGLAQNLDQYVEEQLAEMGVVADPPRNESQPVNTARKAFAYYRLRLGVLLAGQTSKLFDQYSDHLRKAYKVAKLREKTSELEQMIRQPPTNGKEAQIRRGIEFDAGLAIETCGTLLQAVRRAEITATKYIELNVRITSILQRAGAIQTSRAEGELVEGRFPWVRKPVFSYYDPRSSVGLVDGRLGPTFLPSFGLASRKTYDVQLRGRFLECERVG